MTASNRPPSRSIATGELHALVLAGGFGRRLEALATRLFGEPIPKQFCRFRGGRSLLQQTLDRLAPLAPSHLTTLVVDASQRSRAVAQLESFPGVDLVVQPCDRGTAAGVLLPLLHLVARAPTARVVLTASDHGVVDERLFRRTLRTAADAVAERPERLLLLGATAQAANRDYGWIVRGAPLDGARGIERVARFVEKPDGVTADELFASGRAWWNTMVMVASASALLDLFRAEQPCLTAALEALLAREEPHGERFARAYAELPAANFSADVIGRAASLGALALPAAAGWTDLGTEERLFEWLERDGARGEAQSGAIAAEGERAAAASAALERSAVNSS